MGRKIEKIVCWVVIIEALLKIIGIHFPVQSQLFIITASTASWMYFLGEFVLFNPSGNFTFKKDGDVPGDVFLGILYGLACTALLFTLFFWPGSVQFWTVVLCISILLVIYLLVRMQMKDAEKVAHRKFLLKRTLAMLIISLVLYVTPPSFILRIVHRDKDEEYLDKMGKTIDHPENIQYKKEWRSYRMKLDSINNVK